MDFNGLNRKTVRWHCGQLRIKQQLRLCSIVAKKTEENQRKLPENCPNQISPKIMRLLYYIKGRKLLCYIRIKSNRNDLVC